MHKIIIIEIITIKNSMTLLKEAAIYIIFLPNGRTEPKDRASFAVNYYCFIFSPFVL